MSNSLIIHILRNYAPSSLNRGEDGSPKSAMFGGTWRGRISSQSLKRAIRRSESFSEFSDVNLLGVRTRQLPILVGGELARMGWRTDDVDAVIKRLSEIGKKSEKAEKEVGLTNQMILIPATAPADLARQIVALYGTKAWATELEKIMSPVDMMGVDTALFGSMTTSSIFPDVHAACQVSHALGVNQNMRMTDFFTAVDDLTSDTGMMGGSRDKEKGDGNFFNSNCYYWSIGVNISVLLSNLKANAALAKSVVGALIEAAGTASPSGKQNSFASHPFSDLVLVEKRCGQIFDYANAFIKPIEPCEERSLTETAMIALSDHIERADRMYGAPAYAGYSSMLDLTVRGERFGRLSDLIEDVIAHVA